MAIAIENPHPVNHAARPVRLLPVVTHHSRLLLAMTFLLWAVPPLSIAAYPAAMRPMPVLLLPCFILAAIALAAAGSVAFGAGGYRHTAWGLLAGVGGAVLWMGAPSLGWIVGGALVIAVAITGYLRAERRA
ncbi:hypothetical protein [Calidifontibacter terrae]